MKKRGAESRAYERQTLQLLELHPVFPEWIARLRKKYEIKIGGGNPKELLEKWDYDDQDSWRKDIINILEHFGLTINYEEAIAFYLVTGSFEGANTSNVRVAVQIRGEKMVTIQILAPASKQEVMDAVMLGTEKMRTQIKIRKIKGKRAAKIVVNPDKWRGAKFRPQLDRDLRANRLWLKKDRKDRTSWLVSDRNIAEDIFGTKGMSDKRLDVIGLKKAKQIYEIRRRLLLEVRRRFPPHTF